MSLLKFVKTLHFNLIYISLIKNNFKQGELVEFIFNQCNNFKIQNEAKFHSVELFDRYISLRFPKNPIINLKKVRRLIFFFLIYGRFMAAHMKEIEVKLKKHQTTDWSRKIEKLKNMLELRALSCIQIATKLDTKYSVNKFRNFFSNFILRQLK